jgi:DNA processing protein
MSSDLLFQLALTEVPHIGHVHAKILSEHFGSAENIFKAKRGDLERIEGIGEARARSIKAFNNFTNAEKEIRFIKKYGLRTFFLKDNGYPQRLLNCPDPPTLLFYKGAADLNARRMVAIVGTRNNTEYGKSFTEKLVKRLADCNCVIVSGLAFGIDSIAHKCALKYDIPTIGVVGHGLDTIYPGQNANLAKQMIQNGGLLTEFRSKTAPDKHNFPARNRVVAGITDATIIVESSVKGGSMITAELAGDYHRDVFAVPGRTIDTKSGGCNKLIAESKAALLMDAEQFVETMGWTTDKKRDVTPQKTMFVELSEAEQKVVELLRANTQLSVDDLNFRAGISVSKLASVLLNLEMQGILKSLPGSRYSLTDD